MSIVQLEHASVRLGGRRVLAPSSLSLEPARTYGLFGPNGAGKTTLIRLILGLQRPADGRVSLFGRPPDDAGRRRVGFVPSTPSLPSGYRVLTALQWIGRLKRWPRHEARRMLDAFGLTDHASARVHRLSRGERQRLQLAIGFGGSPPLLLLDEPLQGLDLDHQLLVWRHIAQARRAGATVLIATHHLAEAQSELTDAVWMAHGSALATERLGGTGPLEHRYLQWRIGRCG